MPTTGAAVTGSKLWITTAKPPKHAEPAQDPGSGYQLPSSPRARLGEFQALEPTAQPGTTGAAMTGSRLWITTAKPPKHAEPAQDPGSGYQLPSPPCAQLGRDPSSGYDRPAQHDGIQGPLTSGIQPQDPTAPPEPWAPPSPAGDPESRTISAQGLSTPAAPPLDARA